MVDYITRMYISGSTAPRWDTGDIRGHWFQWFPLPKTVQGGWKTRRRWMFRGLVRWKILEGLVVWNMFYFSIYRECHHPNWLNHIFFRGVGLKTTNQRVFNCHVWHWRGCVNHPPIHSLEKNHLGHRFSQLWWIGRRSPDGSGLPREVVAWLRDASPGLVVHAGSVRYILHCSRLQTILVGGLEHVFFSHILGIMIPTD